MKYRLFPSLDFLAYLKRIHVAYHAGRDKTDVAKQLILKITSEKVQQKYPQLQVSWELLSYDAPATIDAEFRDGRKYRYPCRPHWQNTAHIAEIFPVIFCLGTARTCWNI
eukprot:GHVT01059126.1.p1 GENE.GHVT01059126.1~~GHVT01059126.1.p1  ORF type:complete len:110 (+),score=4.96 GHVT01059126.1:443-772(+)